MASFKSDWLLWISFTGHHRIRCGMWHVYPFGAFGSSKGIKKRVRSIRPVALSLVKPGSLEIQNWKMKWRIKARPAPKKHSWWLLFPGAVRHNDREQRLWIETHMRFKSWLYHLQDELGQNTCLCWGVRLYQISLFPV